MALLDQLRGTTLFLSFNAGDDEDMKYDGELTILEEAQHGTISQTQGKYDVVTAKTERAFSDRYMSLIIGALKPGGVCALQVPKGTEKVARSFTYGGFTDVSDEAGGEYTIFKGIKPPWVSGASHKLSFLKKKAKPAHAVTVPSASNNVLDKNDVWNLGDDDLADDDIELEDEDDLLNNETLKVDIMAVKQEALKGKGEGARRKACKDCSCGLKEMDDEEAKAAPPVSACGSCGLGDAFRCSGCPFLGKPAFKMGDVVKLSL